MLLFQKNMPVSMAFIASILILNQPQAFGALPRPFNIPLYTFANFAVLSLEITDSKDPGRWVLQLSGQRGTITDDNVQADETFKVLGVVSNDYEDPSRRRYHSDVSLQFPFIRSRSFIQLGGSTEKRLEPIDGMGSEKHTENAPTALLLTERNLERYIEVFHQDGRHIRLPISSLGDTFQKFFSDPIRHARRYTFKVSGSITHKKQEGLIVALVDLEAPDTSLLHLESVFIPFHAPTAIPLQTRRFNRWALVQTLQFDSWNGSVDAVMSYVYPQKRAVEKIRLPLLSCPDIASNDSI
jgi:hypothetical protein